MDLQKDKSVVRAVFLKSLRVMMVSNLSILLCSFVDGLVVSAFLSANHMAAYGLATPLLNIFIVVSYFFTAGLKNICSHLIGAGNLKKANEMYSVAMLFLTVISVLFAISIFFAKDTVADILGAGSQFGELKQLTMDYIFGLAPGIPAFCLTFAFSFVLYLNGNGKIASTIVTVQAVVDIIGDLSSVFIFDGGLVGIGLATSLSNIVAAVLGLYFIKKHPGGLTFSFKDIHIRDIGTICHGGVPSAAERLYVALRALLLNRILLNLVSVEAVSAFAVLNSISPFYAIISLSIAMTILPMASVFHGEHDKKSLLELMRISGKLGILIQIIYSLVIILTAGIMVKIFCHDGGSVYSMAVTAVILYAVSLPFNVINNAYQNYLHAVGHIFKTSIFSMFGNFVFRVVSAYLLGKWFGSVGIWASFIVSDFLTLLLEITVVSIKKKHLALRLDDYADLPEGFGIADDLSMSAITIDEVVKVSRTVGEYVAKYGASSREKNLLSLSVEEMGRNIVVWGFADSKSHILDVRVVKDDDCWIIRIRDDSNVINPNQWVQIHHPEDEIANLGFRIVSGVAKDIQYTSSLGINNLILKIQHNEI